MKSVISTSNRGVLRASSSRRAPASRPLGQHICKAGKVTKITGAEFENEVVNRKCNLVVDFYATWCGPCVMLAKELDQVAEILGEEVRIVKIDTDENQELSSAMGIQGLPTILFIPKDETKQAKFAEGLLPAQQIMEILSEL